jgi:hypothetical protein
MLVAFILVVGSTPLGTFFSLTRRVVFLLALILGFPVAAMCFATSVSLFAA